MTLHLHRFADVHALDAALAETVATRVRHAVASRGRASLVVSGGTTPVGLYTRLSTTPLPWDRVCVTLADERWVSAEHRDSNARLVRTTLLRDNAAAARFVPLHNDADDPWTGAPATAAALADIPRPFDLVILGMGADGHTASLFPTDDESFATLASDPAPCVAVRPPSAAHDRISLAPATLLDSAALILHLSGAEKWARLCDALKPGPVHHLPVRLALHQDQVPCHVYWTP